MLNRVVKEVPELDQSLFLALPVIPAGKVLSLTYSPWQLFTQMMPGAIITACATAGEWKPLVSLTEMRATLNRYSFFHFMPEAFWEGAWDLGVVGDLDIVRLGNEQILIPQPSLAIKVLSQSIIELVDEHVEIRRRRTKAS